MIRITAKKSPKKVSEAGLLSMNFRLKNPLTHLLQNLLGLKVKDPKQQENKIMRRRSVFVSVATLWLDAIFFLFQIQMLHLVKI